MTGKSRLFIEPPAFRMPSERSSANPQPHLKIKNINSSLSDIYKIFKSRFNNNGFLKKIVVFELLNLEINNRFII